MVDPSMEAAHYKTLLSTGGWVDLSARAKWRLSGADRIRYLNGQVTQDVRQVRADQTLYACVTNLKGRIESDLFIHSHGESLILDAPGELRETLGLRLEKYIIADDAVLEDITDEWHLLHQIGTVGSQEQSAISSWRYGLPGHDLWLPASAPLPAQPLISAADAEALRVLQHIPAWPHELNSETFPQEAGLETRAMSFTKGCYIGQEILSRIKTTGKMPRELIAWQALDARATLHSGDELFLGERSIGQITSLTRHPGSGHLTGLGYIRQGAAELDSELLVRDAVSSIAASVKISALLKQ